MSPIREMHDIEANGGLAWPEQGKILVYLGCPLDPPPRERMFGEALVDSCARAEVWLRSRAEELYGALTPAQGDLPGLGGPAPVRAGVPGSVYWIYNGAFGMTLGDAKGGASSWAEAEAWFAELASGTAPSPRT